MSLIRFYDMTPEARSAPDDAKWISYRIESSTDGVNWSVFEGPNTLNPPVVDTTNPPVYNFTSVDAPSDSIYFRIIWIDEDSAEQPTEPMTRPTPLPPWTPSLGD